MKTGLKCRKCDLLSKFCECMDKEERMNKVKNTFWKDFLGFNNLEGLDETVETLTLMILSAVIAVIINSLFFQNKSLIVGYTLILLVICLLTIRFIFALRNLRKKNKYKQTSSYEQVFLNKNSLFYMEENFRKN